MGPYTLVDRLGEGGMGTVYLGRSPGGRPVAIKVIRAEYARDERFRRRFRSEVTRARQVPPFCTAEVLDADPDHSPPYLVVEYIDGPNLADVVLERGPLALAGVHSMAVGIATALTAIHGAAVIHRDLKPGNVLFTLGGIKVIDFGIARPLEATSHHTRTDHMVGTIAYMAPERFEPESTARLSPAADIFSWGAVVAYAATGRTPFSADSAPGTVMRILTQPPDLGGLPDPLRDLVASALAKEPHNRPTARELLDLLLAAAPSPSPAARNEAPFLREVLREVERRTPARPEPPPFLAHVVRAAGRTHPPFLEDAVRGGAGQALPESVPAPHEAVRRAGRTPTPFLDEVMQSGEHRSPAGPGRPSVNRPLRGRGSAARRWVTQVGVAATVLAILLAGGLFYRTLGDRDRGTGFGQAGDPNVLDAEGTGGASAEPDGTQAILDGDRLVLLQIRGLGKNLVISSKDEVQLSLAAGEGSAFTLVASNGKHLIRSERAVAPRSCLGVKVASGRLPTLAVSTCEPNDTTLFDITATGEQDVENRPTYLMRNDKYGIVQWSSDRSEIFIEHSDTELVETTFVLVDQGPA